MTFTAAVIQMCTGTDPDRNIERLRVLVAEAAAKGAHYVQTPELTGVLRRSRRGMMEVLRSEAEEPLVAAAADLARQHGIFLHIGSTAILLDAARLPIAPFCFLRKGSGLRPMTRSTCSMSIWTMAKAGGKAPPIRRAATPG